MLALLLTPVCSAILLVVAGILIGHALHGLFEGPATSAHTGSPDRASAARAAAMVPAANANPLQVVPRSHDSYPQRLRRAEELCEEVAKDLNHERQLRITAVISLEEAQRRTKQLAVAAQQADVCRKERNALRESLAQRQEKFDKLWQLHQQAQSELGRMAHSTQEMQTQLEEGQRHLRQVIQQRTAAREAAIALGQQLQQAEQWRDFSESLRRKNLELQNALHEREEQIRRLRLDSDRHRTLADQSEAELARLQEQFELQRDQLERLTAEHGELHVRWQQQCSQTAELQQLLSAAHDRANEVAPSLSPPDSATLEEMRGRLGDACTERDQALAAVTRGDLRLTQLTEQTQLQTQQLMDLQQQLRDTHDQLQRSIQYQADLRRRELSLDTRLRDENERREIAERSHRQTEALLQQRFSEAAELSRQLQAERQSTLTLQSELSQMGQEIEQQATEIAHLQTEQQELQSLRITLENYQQRCQRLESEQQQALQYLRAYREQQDRAA